MKSMNNLFLMAWLISFPLSIHAAQVVVRTAGEDHWQCRAYDSEDNEWIAKSHFELSAANKAFDSCKKQSKNPASCKTAKEYCEAFVNGRTTRSMWQCTAFDELARHWRGNFHTRQDDAILGAKAFCKQRSAIPETCYVSILTCRNILEGS